MLRSLNVLVFLHFCFDSTDLHSTDIKYGISSKYLLFCRIKSYRFGSTLGTVNWKKNLNFSIWLKTHRIICWQFILFMSTVLWLGYLRILSNTQSIKYTSQPDHTSAWSISLCCTSSAWGKGSWHTSQRAIFRRQWISCVVKLASGMSCLLETESISLTHYQFYKHHNFHCALKRIVIPGKL